MKKFTMLLALPVLALGNLYADADSSSGADPATEEKPAAESPKTGGATITIDGNSLKTTNLQFSAENLNLTQESNETEKTSLAREALKDSVVGAQVLETNLHILDGAKFKATKLEKVPEYYVLYYSASW